MSFFESVFVPCADAGGLLCKIRYFSAFVSALHMHRNCLLLLYHQWRRKGENEKKFRLQAHFFQYPWGARDTLTTCKFTVKLPADLSGSYYKFSQRLKL